jgi:hypothetical protein
MVCAHSSLLNAHHVPRSLMSLITSNIDNCGIMLRLSIYRSNCFCTNIPPPERSVDFAITRLLRCKRHSCYRRSLSHHLALSAVYSPERPSSFLDSKPLLSNNSGSEKWDCATSKSSVSISASLFRDRDFCAYIVTHNVLAEV